MAELILRAASFAAAKHRFQQRKDVEGSPYINHPIDVARILAETGGVTDEAVLAAALLHDTVEDTDTTREELVATFGEVIAGIVMEVTDDKTQRKAVRKQAQIDHAAHLSDQAALVKLGDKIANVRDIVDHPPKGWDIERRNEYIDWAAAVVAGCPRVSAVLLADFEAAVERGRRALAAETETTAAG